MAEMVAEPPPPTSPSTSPTTTTTTTQPSSSPSTPKTILGRYQLGRILGRGSFAKVYHARSMQDNKSVAIKIIDKHKTNHALESLILREVEAMRRLDHPNVLRIHEVMATKSRIYLVMELAKGGDLFSKLARRPDHRLPEPLARRCFHQLVSALRFCHQNGVAHRDIKPQNILLDEDGNIKVSDFGLSAVADPNFMSKLTLQTACGTPAFAAPEIIGRTRAGYDGYKADAWSCGVILFVLLTGFLPFDDSNLVIMYRKMHKKDFRFPSWVSKSGRSLIVRLLDPNPNTRLGIDKIRDDTWLKNHSSLFSRSISLGDIASLELELEEKNNEGRDSSSSLNAFEIISMSSGLDLSGMFDEKMGKNRKEKRYTSRESKAKLAEKVVGVGTRLGYEVETREKGTSGSSYVVLGKGRLVLKVVVCELAPELVVVEVKVVNNECGVGWEKEEEQYWEEFISGLAHIAVSWHQ